MARRTTKRSSVRSKVVANRAGKTVAGAKKPSVERPRQSAAKLPPPGPAIDDLDVADFVVRLQDGIRAWQDNAPETEIAAAFHPMVLPVRASLVVGLRKVRDDLAFRPARAFDRALVFAIANWTATHPIGVFQALIELATYLRPVELPDQLHRLLITSALDGESVENRDRTINLLASLAASYALTPKIELFFSELQAQGRWKPEMAARLVRAQIAADPMNWLAFAKARMADWHALEDLAPLYDVRRIFRNLLATAGLPAIVRALVTMEGDDEEEWIAKWLGRGQKPILTRFRREDGIYIRMGQHEIVQPSLEPTTRNPEAWNKYYFRNAFLDAHFPIVDGMGEEIGFAALARYNVVDFAEARKLRQE